MIAASLRRVALAICLTAPILPLCAPSPAHAQQRPDPTIVERQELARMKAEQALKLFGADRWQEAFDWFREADLLFHAPTLSLYMARCQRKMGKLLEARDLYEKLLAEPLAKDAPPAFLEAHDAARAELDALRRVIPTVQIAVSGVPSGMARLTLDGKPLSEEKKELNPGSYTLEASAGGNDKAVKSFTLQEGTSQRIELALRVQPAAPAAEAKKPAAPPPEAAKILAPARGSVIPGAVLLGLGAAGIGAGVATGVVSIGKVNDVKSRCTDAGCSPDDRAKTESARMLGNVSTALFVAGGVAAAAGVVLVVVRPRLGSAPSKGASAGGVVAGVGLGRFELQGRF
jgi:hypothetical protein